MAVTGASEYLGRRMVEYLQKRPETERICVIDVREPPCSTGPKTVFCNIDITSAEAGRLLAEVFRKHRIDTLVHLAFISHPVQDTVYAHELQVIGTMHLLAAAAAARLRKIIFQGETKSYGARPDNPNYLTEKSPLRGLPGCPLIQDLVEVEKQLEEFAAKHPATTCTMLRMGNILSREVDGFIPRLFSRLVVPVVMGYDPLMQFLHHVDAFRALKLAVEGDFPGPFNITAPGVLPLSNVLKLGGRLPLPIPACAWKSAGQFLWQLQAIDLPPSLMNYLCYLFVADGEKARRQMGFRPHYSSLETVQAFFRTSRLAREAYEENHEKAESN